jgi:hypothetical protein
LSGKIPSRRGTWKPFSLRETYPSASLWWPQGTGQLAVLDWKFILVLNYLATQGESAFVSTAVTKKFCAQIREGKKHHFLAKYSLLVGEDLGDCVTVNETCLRHRVSVEFQSYHFCS